MSERHSEAVCELRRDDGTDDTRWLAALRKQALTQRRILLEDNAGDGALGELAHIAQRLGWPYLANPPRELPQDVIDAIPRHLAIEFGVMPLRRGPHDLEVMAVNPFDGQLVADLNFALDLEVKVVVCEPDEVIRLIEQHHGAADPFLQSAAWDDGAGESAAEPESISTHDLEVMAGQAPVVSYVNQVLAQAIRDRASDVHFEPFENDYKVRCRIDGALVEMPSPSRVLALPTASRLKVLANLNIAERRAPQDGRMRISLDERVVDLRVSTLPTQFGESVVLRVLDPATVRLDLAQLGLPERVSQGLQEAIERPHGLLLVTGPTGSGKTTTLYSALRLLNTPERKLLSIEDPVEYETEGVMQVSINPAAGLTFATALRSFLRNDPDVIMVGEIRDVETAQVAVQASLTGHLVMSTLHTNDAPSAITRLIDMGVEPFLLAASVEAVLAQRLVRRICPQCRETYVPPAPVLAQLELQKGVDDGRCFFRGRGCAACNHTGYQGRLGLFEWLAVSEPLRDLIVQRAPARRLREFVREHGARSLREEALQAAWAGETTVDEILRHT